MSERRFDRWSWVTLGVASLILIAIVISTLVIVGLFFPLRLRVQQFIDRRFYRRKYDAALTLAAFAATARDEVDLDALTAELLMAIDRTMQPETLSLWLKEPRNRGQAQGGLHD